MWRVTHASSSETISMAGELSAVILLAMQVQQHCEKGLKHWRAWTSEVCLTLNKDGRMHWEKKVQESWLHGKQGNYNLLEPFLFLLKNICCFCFFCQQFSLKLDAVSRCKQLIKMSDKWWQGKNWQIREGRGRAHNTLQSYCCSKPCVLGKNQHQLKQKSRSLCT